MYLSSGQLIRYRDRERGRRRWTQEGYLAASLLYLAFCVFTRGPEPLPDAEAQQEARQADREVQKRALPAQPITEETMRYIRLQTTALAFGLLAVAGLLADIAIPVAFAQVITAAIHGAVTDPTGVVLPLPGLNRISIVTT